MSKIEFLKSRPVLQPGVVETISAKIPVLSVSRHLICMSDILLAKMGSGFWDFLRLNLPPCAPSATAGSARRLLCQGHTIIINIRNELLPCSPVPLKPLFLQYFWFFFFFFSLTRSRFYGKWAKGTCATHRGKRNPNKNYDFDGIFFINMKTHA